MNYLVAINNNIEEWRESLVPSKERPRLPLSYVLGAALVKRGHSISAVDLSSKANKTGLIEPFKAVYHSKELVKAMQSVDVVLLWGAHGISAILRQLLLNKPKKRVIICSYIWDAGANKEWRTLKLSIGTKIMARFAKGIVLMTTEQERAAKKSLSNNFPVVKLSCGIDTAFYKKESVSGDVPEEYLATVEKLLKKPYFIMPGDELRYNGDALDIVENSNIQIVRISQYSMKSRTDLLKEEIKKRGLSDRFVVFENISYLFLRFLLQNASAYAGLVDASWQPAGWTVACESLACGTPIVLYEGLVSRELQYLGINKNIMRTVPVGDKKKFLEELTHFSNIPEQKQTKEEAMEFSSVKLNMEKTGEEFAGQIELLMARAGQ